MIGSPISASSEIFWCGHRLGPNRLAFEQKSNDVEFSTARTSDHMVLLDVLGLPANQG